MSDSEQSEIELALIGTLIRAPEHIELASARLSRGDFFVEVHGRAFEHIVLLREAGKPVSDRRFVVDSMRSAGIAGDDSIALISRDDLLASVYDAVPANVSDYCDQIVAWSMLWAERRAVHEMQAELENRGANPIEICQRMQSRLEAIASRETLKTRSLYQHSKELVQSLRDSRQSDRPRGLPTGLPSMDGYIGGLVPGELTMICARPSHGKCFAAGTLVRMLDGSLKPIELIARGDRVQGPDGLARNVLMCHSGVDQMYRIDQKYGASYTVNSRHDVVLKRTKTEHKQPKGMVRTFEARDLASREKAFFRRYHGFRVASEGTSNKRDKFLDPYFLGLWLGDGDENQSRISTIDSEVIAWLQEYADRLGQEFHVRRDRTCFTCVIANMRERGKKNGKKRSVQGRLRTLGLLQNKHIPDCYLFSTRKQRLELLAGIIDSDGSINKKRNHSYEITQKRLVFADQIQQLCWSLGYRCQRDVRRIDGVDYHRNTICGDIENIPVKIERKKVSKRSRRMDYQNTPITVTPVGVGEYFGIQVDGDKLFLIEDNTVVHNTALTMQMLKYNAAQGRRCLFVSLEMSGSELSQRMLSTTTGISSSRMRSVDMSDEEIMQLQVAAIEHREIAIEIYDAGKVGVRQVRALAKLMQSTGGVDIVAVDYLQIMRPVDGRKPTNEQIRDSAEGLKDLARELQIPVLCLAQLNRKAESERPSLSHIKGSGDAEQAADQVILIHNPKPENEDHNGERDADLILAKGRNVETGTIKVRWVPRQTEFVEVF